jgi:quercetin dioxygenase-like cupin family protein
MKNITTPKNLNGLIEYQQGSVVSKTLIKESAGSVTLFAFDKSQELSEHSAPYDAMVCVIEGEALISIKGQPHSVKQGEMLIMPADVPHAVKAPEQFKMMLTMIRS